MTLNERMNCFRLASRELFNHFFHVPHATSEASAGPPLNQPSDDADDAWDTEVSFSYVEEVLFEKMVCEPCKLTHVGHGKLQQEIVVKLNSAFCPIMLNREIDSGYWDFPIREVTTEARLLFVTFFDWDALAYRDNRYVLVRVDDWPSHPETVGKRALVESQYVHFIRASVSPQQGSGPKSQEG